MTSSAEQMLRANRAEKIRASKARIPTTRPPIPKGLELKYSVQLRNYQRAINKEYLEVLKPLIATYRQDATTEQIAGTTEKVTMVISEVILNGAVLQNIVRGQGTAIGAWNNNKYSAPIYQIAGLNNISSEQAREMLESWTTENVSLIKGVNDEQIKKIDTLLLRANREFLKPGAITEQIAGIMQSSVKRATLIARDQTLKLNGQIDHVKQTQAGITHFIWRTSRDERVRPRHRAMEGQKYAWDNPPSEGLPGQPVQCRCSAEPSFEELLGPEFAAEGPQSIKAPLPGKKTPKKPTPKPIPSLEPGQPIVVKPITVKTPPTPPTPGVVKPPKRTVVTSGRGKKRSNLTPKQQEFDQNSQWIKKNPKKNRPMATVGERSEWLHWEWVHGSSRKASVNMKAAAKKAFNLKGAVINPHGLKLDLVDDLMIKDVRAIHKATQGQLAKKGVKKVKLWRGVNNLYTEPGAIESWTSDPKVARRFGKHVMEQEIDASRILDYNNSQNWSDGIWGKQSEYMVMR